MEFKLRIDKASKKNRFLFISIVLGSLFLATLYLKIFYTEGVMFEGVFLRKEVGLAESRYIGTHEEGEIQVIVSGLKNSGSYVDVRYLLPNNIDRSYSVYFIDENDWDQGVESINYNGEIIYQGKYIKGDIILIDENGQPLFDDYLGIRFSNQVIFDHNYEIPKLNVVKFASYHHDSIRGKYPYLIGGLLLAIILIIDIKFPLFFFKLKHSLNVNKPEPSDYYITTQRIGWFVYPIIILGLLLFAI